MREIKFRAWDNVLKYWLSVDDMPIVPHDSSDPIFKLENTDNIFLCQWTGLKDKNGVEIFEGDIVQSFDCGEDIGKYEVRWHKKEARYLLFRNGSNEYHWCGLDQGEIDALNLKVIGNIHEHPELLKAA